MSWAHHMLGKRCPDPQCQVHTSGNGPIRQPCWDCIKGRHPICTGWDDDDNRPCDCTEPRESDQHLGWDVAAEIYRPDGSA